MKRKKDDDDSNQGQLIIDATVAPQDIWFPHDVSLLDEARRKTEKIIDALHLASGNENKPRTYRKRARIEFLSFIRGRRRNKQAIRKAIRQQLQYLRRNLKHIKELSEKANPAVLDRKQRHDLMVINEKKKILRMMRRISRMDKGIRQSVEGAFGRLKRKKTLANVYDKLKITSEATIMVCVLLANCEKILRNLFMRIFLFRRIWVHKSSMSSAA